MSIDLNKLLEGTDRGEKYLRVAIVDEDGMMDVCDVCDTFEVESSHVQHAIKKLLCPGIRGSKGEIQDLKEAVNSIAKRIERLERNPVMLSAVEKMSSSVLGCSNCVTCGENIYLTASEFADSYAHICPACKKMGATFDDNVWICTDCGGRETFVKDYDLCVTNGVYICDRCKNNPKRKLIKKIHPGKQN